MNDLPHNPLVDFMIDILQVCQKHQLALRGTGKSDTRVVVTPLTAPAFRSLASAGFTVEEGEPK